MRLHWPFRTPKPAAPPAPDLTALRATWAAAKARYQAAVDCGDDRGAGERWPALEAAARACLEAELAQARGGER
jgi:hypothetical protein